MGVRNQNSTSYVHPDEPNLLNIHKAMAYRDGVPHLRVDLGSDSVTITGDVNLVDNVRINNTEQQSIPVHLTDDPIAVTQSGTWNVGIGTDGQVTLKAGSAVIGKVDVNNWPATQAVTGTFWQATQPVSIASMPTTPVTGTFWQATQPVSGTVTANVTFPTTQQVSGTVALDSTSLSALENISATVSGSVSVSNFPATQPVSGSVSVSNFPATQAVTGTFWQATQPVSGSVSATVSGTVELGTTTLSALENTTVTISGTPTVNIGTIPEVEIKNDSGNPIPISGSVTITQVAGEPTVVKYINTPNNLQMDMTQRLRVAPPTQSWWYAPTVDKDGDLRYIESATGTNAGSLFVQNLSSINMSSGTASNGSFIRISRRRHKLRPGVSMLCAFSINWNGFVPDGNVTKRVGMFTNFNGVFFEMTGDLQIVIRRRLTDGTLVEKRILRENFNIDPLTGVGDSIYNLTPVVINTSAITAYVSKATVAVGATNVYQVVFTVANPSQFYVSQKGRITGVTPTLYNGTVMVTAISGSNVTFVYNVDPGVFSSLSSAKFDHTNLHNQYVFGFDFNGSRATNIRFFIDGPLGRKAIHEESFGGTLSTPFANAPAISTRYEIFNTGSPSRLPNFTASSELVNVEAESELNPSFGSASTSVASAFSKTGDVGNEYAICGIALRASEPYQRADLQVQRVQIVDTGNLNPQNSGIFEWRLVLNPTVSAVPTAINTGKASRFFDYATGTTVSGGTTLTGGYSQGTFTGEVSNALNFLNMGSNIDYTDSDLIVLAVKLIVGGSSNSSVMGMINYIESL